MNSHTMKVNPGSTGRQQSNFMKLLGGAILVICVIASIIAVGLPGASGAASSTLLFGPVADTFVRQSTATGSYATNSQINAVGGSDARQAFLRFNVSGIPAGTAIQSAKLRLVVTNDSTSGGVVAKISNNSWPEATTWNTRPAIDGAQLATLGAVALEALKLIAPHGYTLKDCAAQRMAWNHRILVPLYHPSPQVLITVRRFEQQWQDFQSLRLARDEKLT